jgi:integrating conjugative element protein (TIGR03761 family)
MAMTTESTSAVEKTKTAHQGKLAIPMAQPGSLRTETTMTLQTPQAKRLIEGRRRAKNVAPIIGLMDFGRRSRQIWMSSEADDPYADWCLIKIEGALQDTKQLIGDKSNWLKGVMSGMEGFSINLAKSLQPIDVALSFQNPYGYIGAYIIHDYDVLARMVYTARHIGLLDRADADKVTQDSSTAIRHAFNLSTVWKFTGVTRDDMLQGNEHAQRAIKSLGECPDEVVFKKRRAKIAPFIRPKPSANEPNVDTPDEAAAKIDALGLSALG